MTYMPGATQGKSRCRTLVQGEGNRQHRVRDVCGLTWPPRVLTWNRGEDDGERHRPGGWPLRTGGGVIHVSDRTLLLATDLRRRRRMLRRQQVLQVLQRYEVPANGAQSKIARELGCHRSTICRDVGALLAASLSVPRGRTASPLLTRRRMPTLRECISFSSDGVRALRGFRVGQDRLCLNAVLESCFVCTDSGKCT
jgi:hypothetical protein